MLFASTAPSSRHGRSTATSRVTLSVAAYRRLIWKAAESPLGFAIPYPGWWNVLRARWVIDPVGGPVLHLHVADRSSP
jgi:hypothetical protein